MKAPRVERRLVGQGASANTVTTHLRHLEGFKRVFDGKAVSEISTADINEFLFKARPKVDGSEETPRTMNSIETALKASFKSFPLQDNPTKQLKVERVRIERDYLAEDEVRESLAGVDNVRPRRSWRSCASSASAERIRTASRWLTLSSASSAMVALSATCRSIRPSGTPSTGSSRESACTMSRLKLTPRSLSAVKQQRTKGTKGRGSTLVGAGGPAPRVAATVRTENTKRNPTCPRSDRCRTGRTARATGPSGRRGCSGSRPRPRC